MLVGRASEQRAITEVLDAAKRGRGASLLFRGDPGSGKTTMLEAARECAEDDGFSVLAARGRAADVDVAFAGLAGLLRPLESRFGALPDHLGPAIGAAVGVVQGRARAVDVGWATFRLLVAESEVAPLLLLLDDIQWLDPASWRAILFASTRMSGDAVALVAASRPNERESTPDIDGFSSIVELGGLAVDDLARLVPPTEALADGVLSGCRDRTGGNPLATVELVRSLDPEQRAGRASLPAIPRPGDAIARGFGGRLEHLDPPVRRALVVAAADDTGDAGVVAAALEVLGEDPTSLDGADVAGIIDVDRGRVRFAHPLLRAVAYHQVERSSRRAAHQALAVVLDQSQQAEARAWHLAAGADGTDDPAAEALDLVASRAARRGAAIEAARTYERAAALSPSMADRSRRLVCSARSWLAAGRPERAHPLLVPQVAAFDQLPETVGLSAVVLLVSVIELTDGPDTAAAAALDAASVIADDTAVGSRVLRAIAADDFERGGLGDRGRALAAKLTGLDDWSASLARLVLGDPVVGPRAAPAAVMAADVLDRRLALRRAERLFADGLAGAAREELAPLVDGGDPMDVGVLDLAACSARALDALGRRSDARTELSVLVEAGAGAPAGGRASAEALLADLHVPSGDLSPSLGASSPLDELSPAERRVAVAVGEGRTNKEAAEALYLSVKTVDYHLQGIYRKLGLRSRAELAVLVTRAEVRDE